ncbi:MAG TPA: DUF6364 family protein [Trueperaceae bacterium]|nr:DUF6364 family protein [Trueperaceae bacterium]
MATRNITLSLPEDLVRSAKILAAQQDTSVSALVADLLRQVTDQGGEYDSLWAAEERLMAEGIGLEIGSITWSRDEAHER